MKRLLIVLVLLSVACGGGNGTAKTSPSAAGNSPAPSASPLPFPSPAPGGPTPPAPMAVVCSSQIPPGHQLALVTLRAVQGIVVRDVTDLTHPVTRCGFSGGSNFRFVSSTRVSYIVNTGSLGSPGALYLVDLTTSSTSLVRAWSAGGYASWVYAWSPDGQKLTYLSSDAGGLKWHVLSAAGDKTLSGLGTVGARGVDADNDDAMVGFSADGQYVAVEETFTTQKNAASTTPPIQIVRLSDLKRVYSRADGTMGTWAATGARFYFRTAAGVQVWEPTGKVQSVAAGLEWIRPWPSADGTHIAYTTLNAQGNHQVGIMDTSAANVTQATNEPRANPGFLTPTLVWYQGETLCTTTTPCGFGGPAPTGKYYVYDIAGVESGSVDIAFYDSWPHITGQS